MPSCVDRKEIMRELPAGKERANTDIISTNRLLYGYMRALLSVMAAVNSKVTDSMSFSLDQMVSVL